MKTVSDTHISENVSVVYISTKNNSTIQTIKVNKMVICKPTEQRSKMDMIKTIKHKCYAGPVTSDRKYITETKKPSK